MPPTAGLFQWSWLSQLVLYRKSISGITVLQADELIACIMKLHIIFLQYSHILLLAAGTGIAPMIQVIRHIVNNEDDETFIRLLYACRDYEDILMKADIDEWTSCWNFTVLYALSQVLWSVTVNPVTLASQNFHILLKLQTLIDNLLFLQIC